MSAPRLEARGLRVEHRPRRGARVLALDGFDLRLASGEAVALVGESGAGKSSAALALTGLLPLAAGSVRVRTDDGAALDPAAARAAERRRARRELGWVPQDPGASLDPRRPVAHALGEALAYHRGLRGAELAARVAAGLAAVGLAAEHVARFPHELSGGERQRVALARALALEPGVLVCDEITSALDVSVQAQVLALLAELRRARELALVFVSHDLHVVRHVTERALVLLAGRVVEAGPTAAVLARPRHPYTRALVEASPALAPRPLGAAEALAPLDARGPGCAFAPRCARAEARCRAERPPLASLGEVEAACYAPEAGSGTP